MDTLNLELCARLQQRLRAAEKRARAALEKAGTSGGPLHEATLELLNAHHEIRNLLNEAVGGPSSTDTDQQAVAAAAIEVSREEHEHKSHPKDVLKAIFMWKDDPVERAQRS